LIVVMIKKIAKIRNLEDNSASEDLKFWLSKSPEERISAVEFLRKQANGSSARLQRTVRIIQLSQS